MSKEICTAAIDGAQRWIERAHAALDAAKAAHGADCPVGFPETAYHLPITYALTGLEVRTLADLDRTLHYARNLTPDRPAADCWLPYLGAALDAGSAALFACEALEACRYVNGPHPVQGIWLGAASDVLMRERGVEFVDGTAPGFAAITGAAPTNAIAVRIARELQEKNLYVFMAGRTSSEHGEKQFAEQLAEEGVQLGWESRLVPFGPDASALVYALGFASRAAMAFGNVKPGDARGNLLYNKSRVFAFVLALGEVSAEQYALAAGAITYGFPVVADTAIPEILPSGICTYEHVVASVPHESMVERALDIRGCKVKVTKIDIPVPYGAAFEGELIRKHDVHVEFGGNKSPAFEFVSMVDMDQIPESGVDLVGPDVDTVDRGTALPLAIWVEVAGRKMQSDFEPVLERQIHHLLNGAEGIWHMGQRDLVWTRISRNAFARGLRLKHYGEIIRARLLSDYPAIVDKVHVTLVTDADEVQRRLDYARQVYDQRTRRLAALTDDAVDTFYSCLLCQSFAPNHVCVISPERAGLCGAYTWLDGKAAHEIDNTGPNQPVPKGECLDPERGLWDGVNEYAFQNSHKSVERLCMYSLMDAPMTSCGCFEAICAYVPECNGVMAVPREYAGDTPLGLRFSTLAGNVGGGQQTPGFLGCSKTWFASKKFLQAEGRQARLVWMPTILKEQLRADLEERFQTLGLQDFLGKIADENIAVDAQDIRSFMERVGHPALTLPPMDEFTSPDDTASPVASPETAAAPQPAPVATAAPDVQDAPMPSVAGASVPEASEPAAPLPDDLARLKDDIVGQLKRELKVELGRDIAAAIIDTLQHSFGVASSRPAHTAAPLVTPPVTTPPAASLPDHQAPPAPAVAPVLSAAPTPSGSAASPAQGAASTSPEPRPAPPRAASRIGAIRSFPIRKTATELPVHTVQLGAWAGQGGTRGRCLTVGGATAMPFHLHEATPPHRPRIAMEVFDVVGEKYPPVLRAIYGDLLLDPPAMARVLVERYGADLVSVRLDATHPERGGRTPEQAVELVGSVLRAVDVPLIVTGHNHFESSNETLKAVAKAFSGENLLLNWVESDNYRTLAGAAMAYGHCLVAQSPIDVNIAKQLNILLENMDLSLDRVLIDPTTGALGYGLEYTYSVMERIRLTGLAGDRRLASPMFVAVGPECCRIKEFRALDKDFPAWGALERRAMLWELSTATSLLYAGADVLLLYHPEAALELRRAIDALMDQTRAD